MIQEINGKNVPPSTKPFGQKNISSKNQKSTTESEEIKMEIEVGGSNQLMESLSTQASNNIKSSIESKNLNICNTNMVFFPDKTNILNNMQIQNQNQILIPNQIEKNQIEIQAQTQIPIIKNNLNVNKEEKEIFKFNFINNEENISYTGEYLNEIYSNLLYDEKQAKLKPKIGYMKMQNDINEQMRAILIDWLIEVHYRFRLKSETLFQTVWIIDTYLSIYPIIRARLQLLGIASLLISCKSQEIYYPQLNELIDITDGAYIKEELIEMETHVLKVLNFNIVSPTSNDFYNIIAKAFNFDGRQYLLGKYFLESSLIDYQMMQSKKIVHKKLLKKQREKFVF